MMFDVIIVLPLLRVLIARLGHYSGSGPVLIQEPL